MSSSNAVWVSLKLCYVASDTSPLYKMSCRLAANALVLVLAGCQIPIATHLRGYLMIIDIRVTCCNINCRNLKGEQN